MKVGSLFSGYGGLDLAVGGDLAWYSEIEPAACKVMEAHYPGVPNLGDITKVDWAEVEPVDVITGGYPCQPFSNAGARKGTADERHLWPYVRDALSVLRPQRAVLENVRGHLTLGFEDVLADLAALGLSARWGVVRAADAGAPHNRARLFIVVGDSNDDGQPAGQDGRGLPEGEEPGRAQEPQSNRQSARTSSAFADAAGAERRATKSEHLASGRWASELGERSGITADAGGERHGSGEGPASLGRMGSPPEGSRRQASAARQEPGTGSVARWGDYAPAIDRWQHVIGRPSPSPTIQRAGRDRLNPVFVEWMMGLPEGWVTGHGLSASQQLKMLGNGVVPQQAALALQLLGGAA